LRLALESASRVLQDKPDDVARRRVGKLTGPADSGHRRRQIHSRIVNATDMTGVAIHDCVQVGHQLALGDVIALDGPHASIHLREEPDFLHVDDPVRFNIPKSPKMENDDGKLVPLFAFAPERAEELLPIFRPVYGIFLSIPPGARVPEGLEWSSENGSDRQARIPEKWELHVSDESAGVDWCYWPVTRTTTGLELRRELAHHLERSIERVVLTLDGRPVSDIANAEGIDLFNRRHELCVQHANPWWMQQG